MLSINQDTNKRDLLNSLAKVANQPGDLVIEIESLPSFLTTPIAFTIFTYQISNYPRSVYWLSEDSKILEFLKSANVKIYSPALNSQTEGIEFDLKPEESTFRNQEETPFQNERPQGGLVSVPGQALDSEKTSGIPPQAAAYSTNKKSKDKPQEIKDSTISAQELLYGKQSYKPSLLIETTNLDLKKPKKPNIEKKVVNSQPKLILNSKIKSKEDFGVVTSDFVNPKFEQRLPKKESLGKQEQNLDNWLQRIEATQSALNEVQDENYFLQKRRKSNLVKLFRFSLVSALISGFVFGFFLVFPTYVYSVNIVPQVITREQTLNFQKMDFQSTALNLSTTVQSTPTGNEINQLERATGQVTLINNASGAISFNARGIYLIANNGNEYVHVPQPGEPTTFTVPGRSNSIGQNVVIQVQARAIGEAGSLDVDNSLRIVNTSRRASLGSNFTGLVTSSITINNVTGRKLVTQEDVNNIESQALQQIGGEINQKITTIQEESQNILNPKWYEVKSNAHTLSNQVGEVADILTNTLQSGVEIFSLKQEVVRTRLLESDLNIQTLKEINEITYDASFNPSDFSIDLIVNYSYVGKTNLEEDEIIQILSDTNLSSAEEKLKTRFESIESVEKEEKGLTFLPGISPRVEIELVVQEE